MRIEKLICGDAGHGGSDPGAVGHTPDGKRVEEKGVVLPVTLRMLEVLREHGVPTMATREIDVFVGLTERARIANAAKAKLFISVHANSADNRNATGIETFIFSRTTISQPWGQRVQDSMISKFPGVPNRGLKKANFAVLRETHMPACLAELGFLSNPVECARLVDPATQERFSMALAIAALDTLGMVLVRQQEAASVPECRIPIHDEMIEIADAQEEIVKRLRGLVAG